jgi:homoserine kinase
VRAFELAWRRCGGCGEPRVRVRARSEIPVGRGLGSSGAAIAAGLLLGRAAAESDAAREALAGWGVELEGHPDNVAAALIGGCTLTVPLEGQTPRIVRQPVHASLGFSVAWPHASLETGFARSLLPERVARRDAVENARRLALLLEGLRTGDAELIALGGEDRLHVPHRLPHVPGGSRALRAARDAGAWLATISGAGSALFAISPRDRRAAVAEAMRAELDLASPPAEARVVELAAGAPQVERGRPAVG